MVVVGYGAMWDGVENGGMGRGGMELRMGVWRYGVELRMGVWGEVVLVTNVFGHCAYIVGSD